MYLPAVAFITSPASRILLPKTSLLSTRTTLRHRHVLPSTRQTRPHFTPPTMSFAAPQRPAALPSDTSAQVPIKLGPISFSVSGRLLLCLVPFLMATFIACAKLLYTLPIALSPAMFNACRLSVASLFFTPLLAREKQSRATPAPTRKTRCLRFIRAGIELGAIMFAANYLQILGLRYTDASRAAFLQQLSTVLVPVAAAGMGLEVLTPRLALGALCALAGVAFLTLASAPATTATAVAAASLTRLGDALEIVSALLFAVYLLRTAHHVHSVNGKSSAMVAVKVITQATLSCLWLVSRKLFVGMKASSAAAAGVAMSAAWTPLSVALNVLMVLWGGVMVSGLASWMQTKGQQVVPASEAAILFAAQPLWASVVAYFVFGETMGVCGMAGAGMIVAGTVVSSVGKKGDDA